ncbi:GNAT family N-acetyltransferase [Flavobacterium sp. RSB2_4_14]|uniref:GNAT family N-acetyltransferase n=1 Tax=Flavobacterium sp. RSB2_4_14 TaxID=3447665 RepID=UPI003F3E4F4A
MYKVLIRPLEIADAEVSWKWRNNYKIWELTGSKPSSEITFEIEKHWIEKVVQDETSKRFAILVDDIYVGNIQLTDIIKNDIAEYHIFIGDTDYWNKGIARLASLQIIRYAKNVLKLKKLVLHVNPNHIKAIKLYQSIHFKITSDAIKMELELEKTPLPIVSVFVMVYNHEKYLTYTIDSILMQKSNFDFEIVVGEDCSTDASREILIQYHNRFPGKFNLLLHEENIGAQKNQIEILNNCKGKYIALCEGDDYWTDTLKLQKQVDFLEANSEYSLVGGKAQITENNDLKEIIGGSLNKEFYKIEDLISYNDFITCTVLFRNKKIDLSKLKNIVFGDWLLYCLILSDGSKGKIINEVFSVYRVHNNGVMKSLGIENIEKNLIAQYLLYKREYKFNFSSLGQNEINRISKNILLREFSRKNFLKVIKMIYLNFFLTNNFMLIKWLLFKIFSYVKKRFRSFILYFSLLKHVIMFYLSSKSKKNIFIFPFYHTGGAEKVHLDIIKSLCKKKNLVLFTNFSHNNHFLNDFEKNSKVFHYYKFKHFPIYRKLVNKIFKNLKNSSSITIFGSNSTFFYDILVHLPKTTKKIDLIHSFSFPDEGLEQYSLSKVNYLDKRMVINTKTKNDFIQQYNENGISDEFIDRIEIINIAVDLPEAKTSKRRDREKLEIIYCGRIAKEKRVNIVVEIAKKTHEFANIKIYGHKEIEVKDIDDYYQKNITKPEDLKKIYENADILLITSYREGFPVVIKEAMANGVVCLSTDVGSISEHISNNITGYIVPNEDEQEIINKFSDLIKKLSLDKNLLNQLSDNAFRHANENFKMKTFQNKIKNLIRE